MHTTHYLKKRAALLIAGAVLLQSSLVLAAPVDLSLQQAIDQTLQHNPALQIAGADQRKAVYGIDDAKAGRLPSISLGSSYSVDNHNNDLAANDINNSLRLNWQLYNGGRTDGQLRQAELGRDSADLTVEKTKQQLKLDATTAYYNVLQTGSMVDVNQETVNNLKQHYEQVNAQYEAGIVAKSDVLRSEVELSNAQQNLIKAQNQQSLAISSLNNVMNLAAATELQLTDELNYVPESSTLEDNISIAQNNRPDIAQAKAGVQIAENGVKIAQADKLPSVGLSASSGWSNSLVPDGDNWSVGLSASWNVFDAGSSNAKIKQAKSTLDKAQYQVEQTEDSVEQEVRQAYLSMKEAEKRLEAVKVSSDKAKEDLYIAKEKYSAGVGTNLDVIDAQLALTQARTNQVQALYDYNLNKAKLDKAIGAKVN